MNLSIKDKKIMINLSTRNRNVQKERQQKRRITERYGKGRSRRFFSAMYCKSNNKERKLKKKWNKKKEKYIER